MKKIFLIIALSVLFIPTGISQDLPPYVPTDGLVAYYPFNGNANDASGNGNHGTVNGATLTTDRGGNENSSYSFDGVDDYISGTMQGVNQLNETTVSTWIKYIGDEGGKPYDLFFQYGTYGNHTLAYGYNYSEKKLDLYSNCFEFSRYTSVDLNDDWVNLIITDDNSITKIYVNGILVEFFDAEILNNSCFQGSYEFYVGGGADDQYVTGNIDEIIFWSRALSEEEIQNLYTSSTGDILFNGVVSAENNQIINVADPTEAQDAATKNYVDSNVNSFSGSYNDLTDTPTMYTQAQVDELINNLLDRIVEIENNSAILEDQDGNVFESVLIGNQVWATSDAKNSTYRDGTTIPQITDMNSWNQSTIGAWCYYENDNTKWKLYNWYAVAGIHDNDPNTPNKKFAPEGWRVATDSDWTVLENFLIDNGYNYDGSTSERKFAKAISANNTWVECGNCEDGAPGQDVTANNSTGFSAVPTGYIVNDNFQNGSERAEWWTSTENEEESNKAWKRGINRSYKGFDITTPFKTIGKAVRIIKE